MDNRTGTRRPRGHAGLAAQARRGLGLPEAPGQSELPLPLVHTAIGVAAAAGALALRPDVIGIGPAAIAGVLLALAAGLGLAGCDRLLYRVPTLRALAWAALPSVAIGDLAIVIAATDSTLLRLIVGVAAVVTCGVVPYIAAREQAGVGSTLQRGLREGLAITALAPVMLAGTDATLGLGRALVVVAGVTLTSVVGMRMDLGSTRPAVQLAAGCGVIVGAATLVLPSRLVAGVAAAVLLLLWYGLRGAMVALAAGIRGHWTGFSEHVAVVVLGLALVWVAGGH